MTLSGIHVQWSDSDCPLLCRKSHWDLLTSQFVADDSVGPRRLNMRFSASHEIDWGFTSLVRNNSHL